MPAPWTLLASEPTPEGPLDLRQRGADFLIQIGGRVLMNSAARRSEEALATRSLAGAPPGARVLLGGLGMGCTLRAALDTLPTDAIVDVAELNPIVAQWCEGPLAELTGAAVRDPRVRLRIVDVARWIAEAPAGAYDAILLDLYEGPHAASQRPDDPFYSVAALRRAGRALKRGGVLAIWAEILDAGFERRLAQAGLRPEVHRVKGGSSWEHVVYLARA